MFASDRGRIGDDGRQAGEGLESFDLRPALGVVGERMRESGAGHGLLELRCFTVRFLAQPHLHAAQALDHVVVPDLQAGRRRVALGRAPQILNENEASPRRQCVEIPIRSAFRNKGRRRRRTSAGRVGFFGKAVADTVYVPPYSATIYS